MSALQGETLLSLLLLRLAGPSLDGSTDVPSDNFDEQERSPNSAALPGVARLFHPVASPLPFPWEKLTAAELEGRAWLAEEPGEICDAIAKRCICFAEQLHSSFVLLAFSRHVRGGAGLHSAALLPRLAGWLSCLAAAVSEILRIAVYSDGSELWAVLVSPKKLL